MGCYSVLKQYEHAHQEAIWTVAWVSQDSIVTGGLDTTVKVWKIHSQSGESRILEESTIDDIPLGVVSVDAAPESNIVAIASLDSKIRLFDLDKPIHSGEIKVIDAGPVDSWKVRFSPNGKHLATGGFSGKVDLHRSDVSDTTKTQFDAGKFAYSIDFVSI